MLQSREFQQEYNELCFNWPEYEWGIMKEFPVHIGSTVAVFYSSRYIIVPYFDYIHADSGIMILYIWPFMEGSYTMHTLKNTFIEWAPAVPEWIKEMTICILDLNWYHITFPDHSPTENDFSWQYNKKTPTVISNRCSICFLYAYYF